jgi:hypothetical protein
MQDRIRDERPHMRCTTRTRDAQPHMRCTAMSICGITLGARLYTNYYGRRSMGATETPSFGM